MSGRQLPLPLAAEAALSRADFVTAPGNSAALAIIERWPDWPLHALAIYGPAGCGKTHLAEIWRVNSGAMRVAPPFDVASLSGRALVIEAAHDAVVADPEAFLHLFNQARETGGFLLLTAATPPSRWDVALPDLRSRLATVPAIPVAAPDDVLLAAVLAKHFSDRQLRPGTAVVDFLVARIERSFATARDVVAALDEAALSGRREINIALARLVLERREAARQSGLDLA